MIKTTCGECQWFIPPGNFVQAQCRAHTCIGDARAIVGDGTPYQDDHVVLFAKIPLAERNPSCARFQEDKAARDERIAQVTRADDAGNN